MAMDRQELLWRQFEQHVGLYKDYLSLTLKANAAFYAIAGAIASFVLAHRTDRISGEALFIPIVLGSGLVLLFLYGAVMLRYTRAEMVAIRDELGLQTIPELNVLTALLCLSAAGILTVTVDAIVLWHNG